MGASKHFPRKRFAQHFLTDRHYLERIVSAIALQPDDNAVEIGPGLGALTAELAKRVNSLTVIEIDRDLAAHLRREFPAERVKVVEHDALTYDFGCLGDELRVIGNLPYNVSTPLLFHLAQFAPRLRDLTLMLQKEVVQRMAAEPATAEYGRLTVMLQYRFRIERLFDVPPGAFRPAPKVDSAVVRLVPVVHAVRDEQRLAALVTAAFVQRRKTLRNALRQWFTVQELETLQIDPGARAEQLPVAEFVRMSNGHF